MACSILTKYIKNVDVFCSMFKMTLDVCGIRKLWQVEYTSWV